MIFHLFIKYNEYPIAQQKLVQKALIAFFKSARMRPYSEAIWRNQDNEKITECKAMIKGFVDEFVHFLNSDQCKGAAIFTKAIESMLQERLGKSHANDLLFEGFLRKTLFWAFSEKIDNIQQHFISVGRDLLATEHDLAMERLDKDCLCSFEEYLESAWSKASNDKGNINPTVQQWYGYLKYVESLAEPFKNAKLNTENKYQAEQLSEKISAVCHRIESSSKTIQAHNQSLQEIEEEIKGIIEEKFSTKAEYFIKKSKLPSEDEQYPKKMSGKLKKLTKRYVVLLSKRTRIRKEIAEISTLFSCSKGLDRDSHFVKDFNPYLDYFKNNLIYIKARSADIQKMIDFSSSSKEHDIVYRYVSKPEYNSLLAKKAFDQSREQSNEREKWFFYEGGTPGNGVTHEIACKIFLHKGALRFLLQLQKPDRQHAAVIGKTNENYCIGINEDALEEFNQFIDKIECRDTVTQKLFKTLRFPKQVKDAHLEKTRKKTRPHFLLFTSVTQPEQASHKGCVQCN